MNRAVLLLGLGLVGCGPVTFDKPGATQADFKRDSYECQRDMRQSEFGGGLAAALSREAFGRQCMEARGWSIVKDK